MWREMMMTGLIFGAGFSFIQWVVREALDWIQCAVRNWEDKHSGAKEAREDMDSRET